MSKTLIIDGSNMWNRAYWTAKAKGMNTIFLFLKMLHSHCKNFNTSKVIICWDLREGENGNIRKEENASYKANRKKHEGLYDEFPKLKEITEYLGVQHIFPKRFEADDIMYYLATKKFKDDCIVITQDTDLYQIIGLKYYVEFYSPTEKRLIGRKFLQEKFNVRDGREYIIRKALKGDTSDNIKGVYRITEEKIRQIIDWINENDSDDCPLLNEKQLAKFKHNLSIMRLDRIYSEKEEIEHYDYQLSQNKPIIDKEAFYKACQELKFKSITDKFDKWIAAFQIVDLFDLIDGHIFDSFSN